MTSGGLDLAAVNADDRVLDLLSLRSPVDAGDRVVDLLGSFAESVDEGLEVVLSEPLVVPSPAQGLSVVVSAAAFRPSRSVWQSGRLGRRGGAAAVMVVAIISVSSTAAAVTGDPFTAYEKVKNLVITVTGQDEGRSGPAPQPSEQPRLPGSGSSGRVTPGGGKSGRTAEGSPEPGSRRTPSSRPPAPVTSVPVPTALLPAAQPTPGVPSGPWRSSGHATETPAQPRKAAGSKEPKKSEAPKPAERPKATETAAARTRDRVAGVPTPTQQPVPTGRAKPVPTERAKPSAAEQAEPSAAEQANADKPDKADAERR